MKWDVARPNYLNERAAKLSTFAEIIHFCYQSVLFIIRY